MEIRIESGDATKVRPEKSSIVIAHVVNKIGAWGAGFVLAVDGISHAPKAAYKAWAKQYNENIPLGTVQFVEAVPGLFVANMVAQTDICRSPTQTCLIDYPSLKRCLEIVFARSIRLESKVHMPSGIGSGLAGGDKKVIHDLIKTTAEFVENHSNSAHLVEEATGAKPVLDITLWEYEDVSSPSFVKPK